MGQFTFRLPAGCFFTYMYLLVTNSLTLLIFNISTLWLQCWIRTKYKEYTLYFVAAWPSVCLNTFCLHLPLSNNPRWKWRPSLLTFVCKLLSNEATSSLNLVCILSSHELVNLPPYSFELRSRETSVIKCNFTQYSLNHTMHAITGWKKHMAIMWFLYMLW